MMVWIFSLVQSFNRFLEAVKTWWQNNSTSQKDELLLSLADGNDLAFSAAEYIIAWESLNKAPTDTLSRSLKYTAELIQKEEDEETQK